jgi:hypothetical protein
MPLRRTINKDNLIIRVSLLSIILLLLSLATVVDPVEIYFYKCGFKELTGYDCPTCGISRSIHSATHFELADSFNHNPLGLIIFVSLIIVIAILLLEIITRHKIIVQPKLLKSGRFYISLFSIWMLYWITNNFF